MTFLAIAYEDGYRVYRTTDGRDKHWVGPAWPTPRSAATYIDTLEGRHNVRPGRPPLDGQESSLSAPPDDPAPAHRRPLSPAV